MYTMPPRLVLSRGPTREVARVGSLIRLGCVSIWHGARVFRLFISLRPDRPCSVCFALCPPLVITSPRGSFWTVAVLRFGVVLRFFFRRLRGFLGGNGISSRIAAIRKRDRRANASKAVTARRSHRPSCPFSSATRTSDVPPSVVPHPMLELEPTAGQEAGAF